ncbi:MAG TPA: DUF308 domain-containing protein [Pseudonocardia sp.]|nr:DUF308 domain-containing protein [Pseudonocardia sp.]
MTTERVRHRAVVRRRGSHSWWLAAQGLVAITIGLLAVAFPTITVLALAILLGLGLMVLGMTGLLVRGRSPAGARTRGAVFAGVSVGAGLLCLARPLVGVLALLFGLVLWFFAVGVNDLVHAVLDQRHRVWNAAIGGVSLGVALALATHPAAAVASVALLAGLGFLVRGAFDIGLAAALRRAARGTPTDS